MYVNLKLVGELSTDHGRWVRACACVDDPTKPGLLVMAQYFNQTVEQHLYMYSAPNVTALRSSRTSLTLPVELTIDQISALDSASFDLLGRMAFALQSSSSTSYVFDANPQVLYSGPSLNGTVKLQHCRYSSVLTMIELDPPKHQAYIRLMNSSNGFVHREVRLTNLTSNGSRIIPLAIDPITCNIALQLRVYTFDELNIEVDGELIKFTGPLSDTQEFEILLIIKFAADFSPSFQNSTIFLNERADSKLDSYILSAVFQPETSDLYACFIKKWEITPVKNTTGIVIVRLAAADLSQTMIRHAKPYTDYNLNSDSGDIRLVYDMFRDRVLMLGLTAYFVSWKDSCDSNAADLSPYVDLIPSPPESGPPKNYIVTTTTIKDRKWLTLFCDGMRAIAHASSSEQLLFSNNPVPLVLETLLATAVVVFVVVVVVVARHRGQFQRAPRVAATLATANDWLRELVVGGAPRGIGRFEHVPTQAIPVCCALGPIEHCSDRDGQ
jgi:hypothetical protein